MYLYHCICIFVLCCMNFSHIYDLIAFNLLTISSSDSRVEIINGILDDIKRDAAKIDTMFMDVKFRRSSVEWQSLNSNFTDAISALKKIVSTLQSERDKYDELSGLAVDIFETNSEGDTEFHGLIFPISIKNPGYIEGNVVSWEEKDK